MATDFTWSADAPSAKAARTKTGKTRGSNPPGARTRNEPPRVKPREQYRDEMPGFNYRKPKEVPKPDSIELRRAVAEAVITLGNAHQTYLDAMKAFEALGPLPDAIIQDLPQSMRRHMRAYKTHKPQPAKPPYRVLRRVESETRKDTVYEIRENNFGQIYCTCPSRKQPCKHLNPEEVK